MMPRRAMRTAICLLVVAALASCGKKPEPGTVLDEARQAGISADSAVSYFKPAGEDYFHDMDGGIPLTPEEIKGRNTWIVWTGGNDRLWDKLTVASFGALDFLKVLSSHPSSKFSRDNRWAYFGLVNEPCFEKATGPDPLRKGLWLDKRKADCGPDPFENDKQYPGVAVGARGKTLPVGSYYGYASGIVGLRLFPNPEFDEAAAKKWDPERYYNDPNYYNSKDLIRPYRVGMSCGFCHVGPNPVMPPEKPEQPEWRNLSSNVGAQYFWIDRIFNWQTDPTSYIFQMFHTSRPGTVDTSLISTDNINNPRTMNAVYGLWPRLAQAKRFGEETLGGGSLNNKQLNDYVPADSPLAQFYQKPDKVWTPRVLKDGADSVGALGALNRVYLNIGLFSEEWLLHFNPLIGGKPTTAIEIAVARKNSSYWVATEAQTPYMALFFLKSTAPHKLADAPGGSAYLKADKATLTRGKEVFADNCARCHSSKLPDLPPDANVAGHVGPDYLKYWNAYWAYTKTDEFKTAMRKIVLADDFLEDNFLSTEFRVPVTLLQTNACSPLATNALRNNIWDNFSSETYKTLPSVGVITVYNPVTGAPMEFKMPGGGRGFTRPASLISLWSTAPYLLNNAMGKSSEPKNERYPYDYNPWPSVEKRMEYFDDGITKMLWPEKRDKDPVLGDKVPGLIDRTTTRSYVRIAPGYVPDNLRGLVGWGQRLFPRWFGRTELEKQGGIEIGPIPAGTPIGLLTNLNVLADDSDQFGRVDHDKELLRLALRLKHDLKALPSTAGDDEARKVFANLVEPLMRLSKCPDYVVNRGHYFGTRYLNDTDAADLSDGDKQALIEFVKTF